MRTDMNSAMYEACSNLPFGDQQQCTGSGDPSPNHFTGRPRDTESNLDDFGARYFSSQYGRWMSPDWSESPEPVPYANLGNPQSLNLYAYVSNDPITGEDADGHFRSEQSKKSDDCGFWCHIRRIFYETPDEITEDHREWLLDRAKSESDREKIRKADAVKINATYSCLQNPECGADFKAYVQALAQTAASATITFGHGARHLQGTKLDKGSVEAAIEADVRKSISSGPSQTGNFWGRVTVDGTMIEYRAYTLSNGTINIGTYYIP